jgi:hypothetical protein
MVLLHPITMNNAPAHWFGQNQQLGCKYLGGSAEANNINFLHTTINWATDDCIACGILTPNGTTSSQNHGQCPNALVWLELKVEVQVTWGSK